MHTPKTITIPHPHDQQTLLMLCGGIHPNPGPTLRAKKKEKKQEKKKKKIVLLFRRKQKQNQKRKKKNHQRK